MTDVKARSFHRKRMSLQQQKLKLHSNTKSKSKSKGVYIYSGNSTILVLDNRRWGAGSTSTSFPPVPRSSLDVAISGKEISTPICTVPENGVRTIR